MIEGVAPASLGVAIIGVILQVERIHKSELGWFLLRKDLLIERVEVFAVVDDHFTIGGCHQPLVVGLQI